jgi:hypothetical protein
MITLTHESIELINYCLGKSDIKKSNIRLKKLYDYFNNYYLDKDIPYNIDKILNNNLITNKYISEKIKKTINKFKNKDKVSSKINNHNVIINFYHNETNLDIAIKVILKYIQFMYNISNYGKDIIINYYLSENDKNIGIGRNKLLTTDNVNTGSSSIDNIDIWRKEELLKTTIHELIHHMDLDYRDESDIIIEKYKEKYLINSVRINSFEAYTDYWAILINIFLCSKILNKPYNFFIKAVYLERYFINFQAQKVLYISRTDKNKIIDINKYSNILAYYIIKDELFNNLNSSLDIMNYNIKMKNLNKFNNYLYNLPKITENNKKYSNMNKKSYIYKTMRMSIFDINIFT